MASSADQPASVPPATSTRSIVRGQRHPVPPRLGLERRPRACQSRSRRSCSCLPGRAARGPARAPARATRCSSRATRARRSWRPRQTPRASQPASSRKPARPATVSAALSTPSSAQRGGQPGQAQAQHAAQPQRPAEPPLLPLLRGQPARVELLRPGQRRALRRRSRVRVQLGVLPAQVDPVGAGRRDGGRSRRRTGHGAPPATNRQAVRTWPAGLPDRQHELAGPGRARQVQLAAPGPAACTTSTLASTATSPGHRRRAGTQHRGQPGPRAGADQAGQGRAGERRSQRPNQASPSAGDPAPAPTRRTRPSCPAQPGSRSSAQRGPGRAPA